MDTKRLEISGSCHFECITYALGGKDVSLEYVEHSSDHWHSDTNTSHTIDLAKAREIVRFLQDAFGPALTTTPVARRNALDTSASDVENF